MRFVVVYGMRDCRENNGRGGRGSVWFVFVNAKDVESASNSEVLLTTLSRRWWSLRYINSEQNNTTDQTRTPYITQCTDGQDTQTRQTRAQDEGTAQLLQLLLQLNIYYTYTVCWLCPAFLPPYHRLVLLILTALFIEYFIFNAGLS